MRSFATVLLLLTAAAPLLAGCDQLGIESAEKVAAAKEADGKAVGSACRQAGRAIEDCYALNPKAQRAAVFGGWREMDEYMRENKLEIVAPLLARAGAKTTADADPDASAPPAEPKPAKAKTKAHDA